MKGVGSLLRLVALISHNAFQSQKTPDPDTASALPKLPPALNLLVWLRRYRFECSGPVSTPISGPRTARLAAPECIVTTASAAGPAMISETLLEAPMRSPLRRLTGVQIIG